MTASARRSSLQWIHRAPPAPRLQPRALDYWSGAPSEARKGWTTPSRLAFEHAHGFLRSTHPGAGEVTLGP